MACIIERVGRGGVVVGCTRIVGMTGGEDVKMGGLGKEGTSCDCELIGDPEGIISSDAYLKVVFDFAQDRSF